MVQHIRADRINLLVKVLIPLLCYNYGRFLPECLESILLQTNKNWKVVVRDPGSTDNTEKVMSYYTNKDSRITYIREKGPITCGAAQNRTINENPNFPIIAYHDVDDIMMPDRLERSVKALSYSHIVYGNAKCFGLRNNIITSFPYVTFNLLIHENMINGGTVCFRRKVWKSIGGFDEEDYVWIDYDFWIRAAKAGFKFKYLNQILFLYRIHSKSISKKWLRKRHTLHQRLRKKNKIERNIIKMIILKLICKSWQIYISIKSRSAIAQGLSNS